MSWKTVAGVAVETCQRHVPTFFSIYLGMILPGASKCFFCAMKKILTVMVAAFVCLAAFAQGHASYKEKEHDFGYIKEAKGAVSHTFEFKNTGDKSLVIMQVVTSCGCTRPEFPPSPSSRAKRQKSRSHSIPQGVRAHL